MKCVEDSGRVHVEDSEVRVFCFGEGVVVRLVIFDIVNSQALPAIVLTRKTATKESTHFLLANCAAVAF